MGRRRRVRTILYDDQPIESTELDLLHTPTIQRLYDLHQLGLADRVFLDASHSRLHHVVGVLEQVDRLVDAIIANLEAHPDRSLQYRKGPAQHDLAAVTAKDMADYLRRRRKAARLMGLLHDLTHAPFGHTIEDEIRLVKSKHDDPPRQAKAYYRLLVEYIGWLAIDEGALALENAQPSPPLEQLCRVLRQPGHFDPPETDQFILAVSDLGAPLVAAPSPARRMIRGPTSGDLRGFLADLNFAMRALIHLEALHKDRLDKIAISPAGTYSFEKLISGVLSQVAGSTRPEDDQFHLQRDAFLLDIVGNTICADLLDYAKRDSLFAGLKLDYDVGRIIENFTLVSYWTPRPPDKQELRFLHDPMIRSAISLFSHKLRLDMPGELINLLQIRYYVYERVLFHPTKCVAGAMLGSALQLIGWKNLPDQYRLTGDAVFLHQIAEVAGAVSDLIATELTRDSGARNAQEVADRLNAHLQAYSSPTLRTAALQLLADRQGEPLNTIQRDLLAASALLRRLSARRYFRPVFRLLPNVEVEQLNVNADDIAAAFLDPTRRRHAERSIEQAAGLPHGAVAIHCPTSEGPTKIASALVVVPPGVAGQTERAFPLREIGHIDDRIFKKHEEAIRALEEMYRSMWRLVVSVSPPHYARWREINLHVSDILYKELSGTASNGHVPNDRMMEVELQGAEGRGSDSDHEAVDIYFDDGRRLRIQRRELELGQIAAERLRVASPRIEAYVQDGRWAAETGAPSFEDEITRLIQPSSTAEAKFDDDSTQRNPRRHKNKRTP